MEWLKIREEVGGASFKGRPPKNDTADQFAHDSPWQWHWIPSFEPVLELTSVTLCSFGSERFRNPARIQLRFYVSEHFKAKIDPLSSSLASFFGSLEQIFSEPAHMATSILLSGRSLAYQTQFASRKRERKSLRLC